MCGIVGIVSQDANKKDLEIKKAVNSIKHRGSDEDGLFCFSSCILGHVRLSIVDLGGGRQPMISLNRQIGVVFNGEIYGYSDIKGSLPDYNFKTNSDTELLLALYEKYSERMLEKLPGMFAFAIWDEVNEKLFCARDRFGEKPLYYTISKDGEFIFASEIKAIIATGLVVPEIDLSSLAHYLKRLYVHPNKTIYKNIFTLPPAHYLTFKDGGVEVKRYWFLSEEREIDIEEAVKEFRCLLEGSIKKQLVADVPVGAFLSGGIDSTTIVAIASKYKKDLQTYSFGFGDDINELPFARAAAGQYRTKHIELHARDYNISELLLEMQNVFDEPFADSSNIPTYIISKLARGHVKVVLTGDGGDELFGGYLNWYKPLVYMDELRNNFFHTILFVAKSFIKNLFYNRKEIYYQLQGLKLKKKFKTIGAAHCQQNIYFSDKEIENIFLADYEKMHDTYLHNAQNSLNDAMRSDLVDYMPGDILVKIDRAAMANGLELRAPFLDYEFANFCISLPVRLKITKDNDKVILREAFSEVWPEKIRNRKKQGFGAPLDKWLSDEGVRRLVEEYLENKNSKIFKIISFEKSRKYTHGDKYKTWAFLILAIWMEKHDFVL